MDQQVFAKPEEKKEGAFESLVKGYPNKLDELRAGIKAGKKTSIFVPITWPKLSKLNKEELEKSGNIMLKANIVISISGKKTEGFQSTLGEILIPYAKKMKIGESATISATTRGISKSEFNVLCDVATLIPGLVVPGDKEEVYLKIEKTNGMINLQRTYTKQGYEHIGSILVLKVTATPPVPAPALPTPETKPPTPTITVEEKPAAPPITVPKESIDVSKIYTAEKSEEIRTALSALKPGECIEIKITKINLRHLLTNFSEEFKAGKLKIEGDEKKFETNLIVTFKILKVSE